MRKNQSIEDALPAILLYISRTRRSADIRKKPVMKHIIKMSEKFPAIPKRYSIIEAIAMSKSTKVLFFLFYLT